MPFALGIINWCMEMIFVRAKALENKTETMCNRARVHITNVLTQMGNLNVVQFGSGFF